ncbi:MAG TPA: 2,3-bisphosphoglycerate-independent phosphoglycerate mutase [Candidatus Aminicenantes bacterium]|nr:2,3-bisphosphoglycerate-independent phosphoglycerate mutase [Candidatus Aminicenantes bacterium]HRY64137.1 2,3-bisphosphoglycerate-independent phosphoglycerate mutase [Candidatus Aminicenantes bacterium]HRZ71050.1 2,3-bisphosphoglycerate-independent phosphoglycerate mutase [Candidatus Aminicenantes bacterium]
MEWEDLARELSQQTDSKIVLLVMDGVGGLPADGKSELEAARKPYLDGLARNGVCGVTDPVMMGITPGSGPSHLALFGYDPLKYQLGRGILEALGSGVEVGRNDLVARGNFATLKGGLVVDRRAGRIPTEENARICEYLNGRLPKREGVEVRVFPGKEHRFVARFTADGLADDLTDADPQKEGRPPVPTTPLAPEAAKASGIVNRFLDDVAEVLAGEAKANAALLRGFSKFPSIPTMQSLFKLRPAAVANYPMYKGLAKLLGMEVIGVGGQTADLFDALEKNWAEHDFFYVHYKRTDSTGEDGNFDAKVAAIEALDPFLPRLAALKPDVLVVTSDHSTPSALKGHSWHPNPFLLVSPTAGADDVPAFTERTCAKGLLGRFRSISAMPLMLAHALKLQKYGA